ncbi:hypothetical protein BT96DRAFT_1037695 [Gymnopus androsaceus JB14]|uniref:Nucleoporin POM152 ninth Ig-like domain-containing protein n=1 Tax=Gymnopus androsaceus JB14 TaxID=1447944 RepID=A0A6A4HGM9_9AGAR|nr:hypothetical protein BT96DRAFT_1037695 [Gymnopus androsaceus JB14]
MPVYRVSVFLGEDPPLSLIQKRLMTFLATFGTSKLHTSDSGRVYYEVKQIGDRNYPLEKHRNTLILRSARLVFEQQVSIRHTARFANRNRMMYCLHDKFTPLDKPSSDDGTVVLEGKPPFQIELPIKNIAASHVNRQTIEVYDHTWKINLNYQFNAIGPHLIVIESVADASHYVAEKASIVPVDRREDFCVGQVAQFQLEGTPPWSVGYRINGKAYTQEAKVSPFSLIQQLPGSLP